MNSLKAIVHKHLGRKVNVRQVLVSILAVDQGIKPAYLYDESAPDSGKLHNLLTDLHSNKFIQNSLNIINIGLDCLIVNVEEVRTNECENCIDSCIDVSWKLKKPRLLSNTSPVMSLVSAYKEMVTCLDSGSMKVVDFECMEGCNVSSLFGLLLNYPVVYWYDVAADLEVNNCLSMEQLTVVKLSVTLHAARHCGTPEELSRLFSGDSAETEHKHILYQFSFPSELGGHCTGLVNRWFDKVKQKVGKCEVFVNPRVVTEEVVLDSVIL